MTLSVRLNNNLIGFWGFRVRHSVNLNNQLMIKRLTLHAPSSLQFLGENNFIGWCHQGYDIDMTSNIALV